MNSFLTGSGPIFDVRSPKEFAHARIPGAINLPLFSDSERAIVGTAYKKQGKEEAIRLGVKIVGPKLDALLTAAFEHASSKEGARVYCWRGGMRSGFVSYLLNFSGIPSLQLAGGYKAFRRFVLETVAKPYKLALIGGLTGSGKTELLRQLAPEETIDLEALACHSGSVFGGLHGSPQPTTEQFENELAMKLFSIDSSKEIWVEDESRLIGRCQIPSAFYEAMKSSPLYLIKTTKEARIARIMEQYGAYSCEQLRGATTKLARRLGGQMLKTVLEHLDSGRYESAFWLLLDYYDKAYEHALTKHKGSIIPFPFHLFMER